MARSRHDRSLTAQLRMMLDMAGADPKRWIIGTVLASLVLAALDTIGVAAMVPLTQLITGDTDSWFVEWLEQVLGTTELSTLIPVVAAFITIVFNLKSIGALVFRWWLRERHPGGDADRVQGSEHEGGGDGADDPPLRVRAGHVEHHAQLRGQAPLASALCHRFPPQLALDLGRAGLTES